MERQANVPSVEETYNYRIKNKMVYTRYGAK